MMYSKDMILNSHWYDPNKTHHTHPCFFGTAEEIIQDCCGHCPPIPEEFDEPNSPFVSGKLAWIVVNPGAQAKIGSFHPITEGDWTEGAYLNEDAQSIISLSNANDVEGLKKLLQNEEKEKKIWDVNGRDQLGRTPLMIASFAGATDAVRFLIQNGARISAHMPDGRTALHIAAEYGFHEIVEEILIRKEEIDKEKVDSEVESGEESSGESEGKKEKGSEEEEEGEEEEEEEEEEGSDEDFKSINRRINKKKKKELKEGEWIDDLNIEGEEWDTRTTPLEFALALGHVKVVSSLLKRMTLKDASKYFNQISNHPDMVQVLLDNGFSLISKNEMGSKSFVTFCCENNKLEALQAAFKWCKEHNYAFKEAWDALSDPNGSFKQYLQNTIEEHQVGEKLPFNFNFYWTDQQTQENIKQSNRNMMKQLEETTEKIPQKEDVISDARFKMIEFLVKEVKVSVQYSVKKTEVPSIPVNTSINHPQAFSQSTGLFGFNQPQPFPMTLPSINNNNASVLSAGQNIAPASLDDEEVEKIPENQQPIYYAVALGSDRLVKLLVEHGADPPKLKSGKQFTLVNLARSKLNEAESAIPQQKSELTQLEKRRNQIIETAQGAEKKEEEEPVVRNAEYQMLLRQIEDTQSDSFWALELKELKERKYPENPKKNTSFSKNYYNRNANNSVETQLDSVQVEILYNKRNTAIWEKRIDLRKRILKDMEEVCKSPPISFQVEFFRESWMKDPILKEKKTKEQLKEEEAKKEGERTAYFDLFGAIYKGDVDQVRKLTTDQPVGQQLHVMAKATHSQMTTLDVAILRRDARMVFEILKIAKEQFTPLPKVVEDNDHKQVPFNNYDLINNHIRPGDFLDAQGRKKKGKKTERNTNVGIQINCLIHPKRFLNQNTMQRVIKSSDEVLSSVLFAFPEDEKWIKNILITQNPMAFCIEERKEGMISILLEASKKVPKAKEVAVYEGLDVGGKKSDWADEHRALKGDSPHEDALNIAISQKNIPMIKFILQKSLAIDSEASSGFVYELDLRFNTYLSVVSMVDNLEILQTLVDFDSEAHKKDSNYVFNQQQPHTLLGLTTYYIRSKLEKSFDILVKAGANLYSLPVHDALIYGVPPTFLKKVLESATPSQVTAVDNLGNSALSLASMSYGSELVKIILDDGRIDPLQRNHQKFNALDLAINAGRIQNFELLQPFYSKDILEKENSVGRTPFDCILSSWLQTKGSDAPTRIQRPEKRVLASREDTTDAVKSVLSIVSPLNTVTSTSFNLPAPNKGGTLF
eukprot:TRINITY_DN1074_c0_g1_i1.p1 TRINITY_DN1074_c0_g1~~TRINITY_DN1074_c0_g1_i1.p1  ORF type:complete len:1339 (+),score=623.19 TRINITY_DN1074_c0_g1_i1:199-4017(+)